MFKKRTQFSIFPQNNSYPLDQTEGTINYKSFVSIFLQVNESITFDTNHEIIISRTELLSLTGLSAMATQIWKLLSVLSWITI